VRGSFSMASWSNRALRRNFCGKVGT
jgi:hypothetical protein